MATQVEGFEIRVRADGAKEAAKAVQDIGTQAEAASPKVVKLDQAAGRLSGRGPASVTRELGRTRASADAATGATRKLEDELRRLQAQPLTVSKHFEAARVEASAMSAAVVGASSGVARLGAAIAAIAGAGAFAHIADNFTNANSQLALITKNEQERAVLSEKVFEIAQATGTSYESQAKLVARVANATQQYGATQAQVLKV